MEEVHGQHVLPAENGPRDDDGAAVVLEHVVADHLQVARFPFFWVCVWGGGGGGCWFVLSVCRSTNQSVKSTNHPSRAPTHRV